MWGLRLGGAEGACTLHTSRPSATSPANPLAKSGDPAVFEREL
jgi:hypothetical protein